jgi:hypothetical protein
MRAAITNVPTEKPGYECSEQRQEDGKIVRHGAP